VPLLSPQVAAFMGTAGELLLPPLLAIGLAGRLAAAGLFVVNVMAVVSYPALWEFECPAAFDAHVWWGVGLLVLTAFGPARCRLTGCWAGVAAGTETSCNTAVIVWGNVSATLLARQSFNPGHPP
jgi:uncharacterized membrane protein YphA (DoxX/SURF4 family)